MKADEAAKLRPFDSLDELTERVLGVAYQGYAQARLVAGANLRFDARANDEQVRFITEKLRLITEGSSADGSSGYRPTILGLLYIDKALANLDALDRLAMFAHDRYRPDHMVVPAEDIDRALALDPAQKARLALFSTSGELPFVLGTKGHLSLSERCLEERTLSDVILRVRKTLLPWTRNRSGSNPADTPPPFRLRPTALHVSGFRVLRDVSLTLEPLTVLVGPNAVGKSTLLDVFGFLRNIARQSANVPSPGLGGALIAEGGFDRIRTAGAATALEIDLSFELVHGTGAHVPGKYALAIGDLHGDPVLERERLILIENGERRRIIDGGRGRAEILGKDGEMRPVYLGGQETALGTEELPQASPLIRQISSALARIALIDRDPTTRPFEPWTRPGPSRPVRHRQPTEPEHLLRPVLESPELVQKMGRALRELIPGFKSLDAVRPTGGAPILVIDELHSGQRTFDEISSGSRQMILLSAILVTPSPPTLLLLEEIDAAVHPGAHAALVDLLASVARKTSVIVTTHSPAFIGRLDPKVVRVLQRDAADVRVTSLADALESSAWLSSFDSTAEAFLRAAQESKADRKPESKEERKS